MKRALGGVAVIAGVGLDCVQVERMAKSVEKEHFLRRVFHEEERRLLVQKGKKMAQSAAACFAAKEAFLKAAGVGLGGFALCDIAALRKDSGQPYYAFFGTALAYVRENHLTAHLSLTHEGGLAMAVAVLERRDATIGAT